MIIPVIDIIATILFFGAFLVSAQNYAITKDRTRYWQVLSLASFTAFVWSLMVSLEWIGIYPTILDSIQQSIVPMAAMSFVMASMIIIPTKKVSM